MEFIGTESFGAIQQQQNSDSANSGSTKQGTQNIRNKPNHANE